MALRRNSASVNPGTAIVKDDSSKSSCKGQNACKGQGNCSSGDNGCKGKNSCKGHGGCKGDTLLIVLKAAGGASRQPDTTESRALCPCSRFYSQQPADARAFLTGRIGAIFQSSAFQFSSLSLATRPTVPTPSPIKASASACASRTATSWKKSRSSTGLRSFRKISWSMAAARSRCSTASWNNTAWCGASRCISARPDPLDRAHLKKLKTPRQAHQTRNWIIFAGAAWTELTRMTCCPCPTLSPPRNAPPKKSARCAIMSRCPSALRMSAVTPRFLRFRNDQWEFLSEVVELADCGILLDVNNIYVSSKTRLRRPRLHQRRPRATRSARFTSPATRS